MSFDTADLKKMAQNGTLNDVITHEMGHVLGIGTIWDREGLLKGAGTDPNPTFDGKSAKRQYRLLRGSGSSRQRAAGEHGQPRHPPSHWRETIFRNELMSGFIVGSGNPA